MSLQTLAGFVARSSGHRLDFDGVWPGQCVDLARCYLRDCFGLAYEPPPMPGAVDWWRRRADSPAPGQQLQWIANRVGDASQFPRAGDVVVWGPDPRVGTGSYGHIDVFLSGDGLHFHGFDQNWPIGSPAHVQLHDYRGVLGWGRPLAAPVTAPVVSQTPSAPSPAVPPSPPAAAPPPAPVTSPPAMPPPESATSPPPESITPPAIPEPGPLVEQGVTTSEWRMAIGYLAQGAGLVTAEVVNVVAGTVFHVSVQIPAPLLQLLVDLEFAAAGVVGVYVIGRSIRKAAAKPPSGPPTL